MKQLTIFDAPLHEGVTDLPRAILEPPNPKIEEAIASLRELKAISLESEASSQASRELTEGCLVRSNLFFKGKTAKVISLEAIGSVTLATVEIDLNGYLTRFPCGISALEVVE